MIMRFVGVHDALVRRPDTTESSPLHWQDLSPKWWLECHSSRMCCLCRDFTELQHPCTVKHAPSELLQLGPYEIRRDIAKRTCGGGHEVIYPFDAHHAPAQCSTTMIVPLQHAVWRWLLQLLFVLVLSGFA